MTGVQAHHTPKCRIAHPRDVDCADAAWIRYSAARAARRECPDAPSRTQPHHAFDIHGTGGECEHCGTPWDPSRDGADDA